jgi:ketosteroid isomerase-like protein
MKPMFDQFNLEIELNLKEGKVYGDHGMTRCTYSLALIPKEGGKPVPAMPDGKALTLYRRQTDDTWKIIYDCFNFNIPP